MSKRSHQGPEYFLEPEPKRLCLDEFVVQQREVDKLFSKLQAAQDDIYNFLNRHPDAESVETQYIALIYLQHLRNRILEQFEVISHFHERQEKERQCQNDRLNNPFAHLQNITG
jgi:hypothetical protein